MRKCFYAKYTDQKTHGPEFGISINSAEGAEYDSQGQVRREAEHVAPGKRFNVLGALKERNTAGDYFGLSGLNLTMAYLTRGDALASLTLARGFHITRLRRCSDSEDLERLSSPLSLITLGEIHWIAGLPPSGDLVSLSS